MSEFSNAPGKKTSEFYAMIISTVVGLLVVFKIVEPVAGTELTSSLNVIVASILGLVTAIGPGVAYIFGRTWLKAKTAKDLKNG
ncbi:MAG: hypothetical protein KAV87_35685 [Desulfobacteraceae bacterium]|nr:hypothetical protein [Desulfobacteraceae bacterium]